MLKLTQLLTTATISVAASAAAWAGPTLTSVDFPGAISTSLNGGPNPEGTFIGTYSSDGVIFHGFTLEKGIYTTIDPPGSVSTTPNWISPEGTIVGGFTDTGGVSHGFILEGGTYT